MGVEQLYDLTADPLEQVNLMESASGTDLVAVFRKMLLDVLTANPGSIEVEKAYMATYRQWLEEIVRVDSSPPLATDDRVAEDSMRKSPARPHR